MIAFSSIGFGIIHFSTMPAPRVPHRESCGCSCYAIKSPRAIFETGTGFFRRSFDGGAVFERRHYSKKGTNCESTVFMMHSRV